MSSVASLTLSIYVCVCPHSKRKSAWVIDTKLAERILYGRTSSCVDPEVRRSEVKVTWFWSVLSATVCMSIWLDRCLVTTRATVSISIIIIISVHHQQFHVAHRRHYRWHSTCDDYKTMRACVVSSSHPSARPLRRRFLLLLRLTFTRTLIKDRSTPTDDCSRNHDASRDAQRIRDV